MNIRSFVVGVVAIVVIILASVGIYRLYKNRVVSKVPVPSPAASIIGFPTSPSPFASPTPFTSPTLGTTPPSTQPEAGSQLGVRNIGIFITSPKNSTAITSPVKVSGYANVFEGNIQIRIKDASGKIIGSGQTTACMDTDACPFDVNVSFQFPSTLSGTVEVFNPSPLDGSQSYKQTLSIFFAN